MDRPYYALTLLIAVVTTCAVSSSAFAASGPGATAFGFLRIPPDARQAALGGAFTAIGANINALASNPAGLARLPTSQLSLTYANYLLDIQYGLISYARPFGNQTIGVGIQYLSYGEFRQTTATDPIGATSGTFSAGDVAVRVAYARKVGAYLAIGTTGTVLYERIRNVSMDAFALDIGVQFHHPKRRLSAGIALQNWGVVRNGLTTGRRDPLPTSVRIGIGYIPQNLPALLVAEMDAGRGVRAGRFGVEFNVRERAFLRAGYATTGRDLRLRSSDFKLTGGSIGIGVLVRRIRMDYALTPTPRLGVIHRFTVTYGLK